MRAEQRAKKQAERAAELERLVRWIYEEPEWVHEWGPTMPADLSAILDAVVDEEPTE